MKARQNEVLLSFMLSVSLLCLTESGCTVTMRRMAEDSTCTCAKDSVSVDLFFTSIPRKDCAEKCDEQNKGLHDIVLEFKTASSAAQRVASLAKLNEYIFSIREGGGTLKIDVLMDLLGCAINAKGSGSCCFVIRDADLMPNSLTIMWDCDRNIVESIFRQGWHA